MRKRETIWMTSMLAIALSGAWAQDSPPAQESAQGGQQPVSAYGQGQDNAPSASNNPPISGLDVPSLEPSAAPLSYLQPGATVSESADTNIGDALGGGSVGSVTRALGSLTLRRLWSHYDLALDYLGGVAYYTTNGVGLKQLHDLGLDQKIAWKRGQLSIRDSFSYYRKEISATSTVRWARREFCRWGIRRSDLSGAERLWGRLGLRRAS